MAYADYACCSVCDDKMYYSSNAWSKTEICSYCVLALAKRGVYVAPPSELLEWMRSKDPRRVVQTLNEVGFKPCVYGNDIDDEF